jgi:phosphoenolpyruvate---glycerone phosphotransferase subunit DhaL
MAAPGTLHVVNAVVVAIEANADALSTLDAVGGDGDHGVSLTIGARAVQIALTAEPPATLGAAFQKIGMTLVNAVGAAMGPIFGTAFIRAGVAANAAFALDGNAVATILKAAVEGVQVRGKAVAGDKTMLDALIPAAEAAQAAAAGGADAVAALRAACAAADAGARSTSDMIAKRGRAAKLGERTRGHQDAGATSTALILRTVLHELDTSVPEPQLEAQR